MIYAIVRNREKFKKLESLTFIDAMNEVARLKALRKQKNLDAAVESPDSAQPIFSLADDEKEAQDDDDSPPTTMSQKAKGKLPVDYAASPPRIIT